MGARPLPRVALRPSPADWGDDDQMLLDEYIAVFYPAGPLTVSSLRTEIRKGALAYSPIAGKYYITPGAVRAMFKAAQCPAKPKAPVSTSVRAVSSQAPESDDIPSGSSAMDRLSLARASLANSLTQLGSSSPSTSPGSGRRPSKVVTLPTRNRS